MKYRETFLALFSADSYISSVGQDNTGAINQWIIVQDDNASQMTWLPVVVAAFLVLIIVCLTVIFAVIFYKNRRGEATKSLITA